MSGHNVKLCGCGACALARGLAAAELPTTIQAARAVLAADPYATLRLVPDEGPNPRGMIDSDGAVMVDPRPSDNRPDGLARFD